jgi:hypothetical protein
MGYGFNFYAYKRLKEMGASWVKREVPCGNTQIDVLASLCGNEQVKTILPDFQEVFCCLNKGKHTFEAKAAGALNRKACQQIRAARGQYKNCHVLVLADTCVSYEINKAIRNLGGDIVRAEITKKQVLEKVLEVKKPRYSFIDKMLCDYSLHHAYSLN